MSDHPKHDEIQREIDDNDVVLFMKGSPMMPQCGFSAAVSQVLTVLGVKFKGVDVWPIRNCAMKLKISAIGRRSRSST